MAPDTKSTDPQATPRPAPGSAADGAETPERSGAEGQVERVRDALSTLTPPWLPRYIHVERTIAVVLLVGMISVTLIATVNFLISIPGQAPALASGLPYSAFQTLFDKALAAIIALELAHSVHQTALGKHGLIQVRTVVVIGVLAVVRKFVLIDIDTVSGLVLLGLGMAVLALGVVYALTHWVEEKLNADSHRE